MYTRCTLSTYLSIHLGLSAKHSRLGPTSFGAFGIKRGTLSLECEALKTEFSSNYRKSII